MNANIIDGRMAANALMNDIKLKVAAKTAIGSRKPGLAVVQIGDNRASTIYIQKKAEACEFTGINSKILKLARNTSREDLINLIESLNNDANIDGILVQLPLPSHLDPLTVIKALDPNKDVDGFHPINVGKLVLGESCLKPCTPSGIMHLLKSIPLDLEGKNAIVIGRSNIVGKPISVELVNSGCTVTICNSKTHELPAKVATADIVIAALGKPEFIQGKWLKEGCVAIDVGINRSTCNDIVGDIEFATAKEKAAWITPVPGGVGPMTVAMLMQNTYESYIKNLK